MFFGKLQGMTHLCKGIYCKSDILTIALTNAVNMTSLSRRLMTGVFIPSKIMDCTVTGQTWHAGGEDRRKEIKKPLHEGALKAIFSMF